MNLTIQAFYLTAWIEKIFDDKSIIYQTDNFDIRGSHPQYKETNLINNFRIDINYNYLNFTNYSENTSGNNYYGYFNAWKANSTIINTYSLVGFTTSFLLHYNYKINSYSYICSDYVSGGYFYSSIDRMTIDVATTNIGYKNVYNNTLSFDWNASNFCSGATLACKIESDNKAVLFTAFTNPGYYNNDYKIDFIWVTINKTNDHYETRKTSYTTSYKWDGSFPLCETIDLGNNYIYLNFVTIYNYYTPGGILLKYNETNDSIQQYSIQNPLGYKDTSSPYGIYYGGFWQSRIDNKTFLFQRSIQKQTGSVLNLVVYVFEGYDIVNSSTNDFNSYTVNPDSVEELLSTLNTSSIERGGIFWIIVSKDQSKLIVAYDSYLIPYSQVFSSSQIIGGFGVEGCFYFIYDSLNHKWKNISNYSNQIDPDKILEGEGDWVMYGSQFEQSYLKFNLVRPSTGGGSSSYPYYNAIMYDLTSDFLSD